MRNALSNAARLQFNQYLAQQATLNGVDPDVVRAGQSFTVTPSVQQTLIERQRESSEFLTRINIVPVSEQQAEKLGLGIGSTLASRTDTDAADRATQDPTTLDNDLYTCKQTNSDTHVKYSKIDLWAKFKDFQLRMRNQVIQQQARDRIMIGFNGTSAATVTNRGTNPLLQDVNVGWLQQIRANKSTHVFAEGAKEEDLIIIDPTAGVGDYRNLDALVFDAVHSFLPAWAQGDTGLVAIVGGGLLHDKYFPFVDREEKPTEKLALDVILSKRELGGHGAVKVPFVPDNSILITRFDNLSIYEQENTRRRTIVDNAKRDRIETYESVNEAYVVEDYDYALLIENIQFGLTPEPAG
jgi:P2 family phage major capsid protein